VIDRVRESMFQWHRVLARASAGSWALEREGVLATVVPAAPERAVVNAVLYRTPEAIEAAYGEVAAAYRAIGARWTVWVWPGDESTARLLEGCGHFLDAEPVAMARALDDVTRAPGRLPPGWTHGRGSAVVGPLNDRAHRHATDSFTRALAGLADEAAHTYVARREGTPVGCLVATDHDGDTRIQMAAVIPEARGRGIATGLLAHALADARERGGRTSTLVATKLGYPVYERAGYDVVARLAMWERGPT
jgi:ribosomal protein S18 acetylase RimI-like enzyme